MIATSKSRWIGAALAMELAACAHHQAQAPASEASTASAWQASQESICPSRRDVIEEGAVGKPIVQPIMPPISALSSLEPRHIGVDHKVRQAFRTIDFAAGKVCITDVTFRTGEINAGRPGSIQQDRTCISQAYVIPEEWERIAKLYCPGQASRPATPYRAAMSNASVSGGDAPGVK